VVPPRDLFAPLERPGATLGRMSDDDEALALSRRQFIQVSAAALVSEGLAAAPVVAAAAPAPAQAAGGQTTVARYIVARLAEHGVKVLFGVPGATCDPFFAAAAAAGSGLQVVVNSSDLEAGYAADGYARMRGLGAVAVTYGVGTLSLLPAIAGAYVERSPVVVVNGGPSGEDLRLQRELGTLFTHSCGRERSDLTVFREVTGYAERAERAADVPRIVDGAIQAALTMQRPAYVEIAKHLWETNCPGPPGALVTTVPASDQEGALAAEILERLRSAARPALLLGIELQRYGLMDGAASLVGKLGIPWATTLLAKSVIPEQTGGFAGVYIGERAMPPVRKLIEGSDALLALGCVMGRQHRQLVTRSFETMMLAAGGSVRMGRKPAAKAALRQLLVELQRQPWQPGPAHQAHLAGFKLPGLSFDERRSSLPAAPPSAAGAERGLTYDEVLRGASDVLDETLVAVTDTSLSMYPAAEMNVIGRQGYVCNAVWQAIGYSVGAAVGVGLAQARRPLVICGDGGFQMTAQALSTMARQKMKAIVIVLDNSAYGIEQWLLDPSYFNSASAPLKPYLALNRWSYADLARSMGFQSARTVETPADFKQALAEAKRAAGPAFITAVLKPRDLPSGLRS